MSQETMSETLTTNSTISHYRISKKIGAGGMGEVYSAFDTRLNRQVALKLLPTDFATDEDRVRRFEQEARATSALNHPNILTVYDIGNHEGVPYIATEFIDGQTLRQQLQGGALKLADALDIATQTASALAAAHEARITHRDIKPENVMLRRDGIVKVLDFGLAKLTERWAPAEVDKEAATRAKVTTAPGAVMGTPQYMSPEQARGQKVDARADIFSLGVMLYEMLAGCPPFDGVNALDVISAILQKEPPPLKSHAAEIPSELQRIVSKALRKDRDERYQTARDLLNELKDLKEELAFAAKQARAGQTERQEVVTAPADAVPTVANAATPTTSSANIIFGEIKRHKLGVLLTLFLLVLAAAGGYFAFSGRGRGGPIESLAVLPFVNAGGNAEVEYLSDGMTETLIGSLSQLPRLSVKARSSVFRYKGKEFDLQKIAQELNVQAILTGRVVQRGDQMTLSLELVDTQTENAIWSEQYNRKQTDLISLQSEIARDVSQKLRSKLSGADEQKLTKKYTENPEAYKLYLKGIFYANRRTAKDVQQAIEHFQQAIAIDPNYALAYAGLANTYTFLFFYGDTPANEAFSKARETVLKALALDDTLADAHGTLAVILINQDRDSAGSERESRRALELNPNFAEGHRRNGFRLMWAGQYEEALAANRRALEIDPLSSVINLNYGMCLFYAGRYAESDAQLKQTLALDANLWLTHNHLFNAYRFKGEHAAAIEALAKSQELRDQPDAAKLIRESFAKGGWPGFLRTMIAERTRAKLSPYVLATCAAELGEKDKAFALLNEAREKGDQFFLFRKIDPLMNPLRGDPRFQELLKNVRPQQ